MNETQPVTIHPDLTVATLKKIGVAIEQALACIRGETPEDCSVEDARQDTIETLREADRLIYDLAACAPVPGDHEIADIFECLHIESMTRQWFAGPNPTVNGYLYVLRNRLARIAARSPQRAEADHA